MPPADYPNRYELSNELHARPFPSLTGPSQTAYIAVKRPVDAANRDRALDREHLVALLDRFGAAHPPKGANHYYGKLGRDMLKWECHTEFVSYTLFATGPEDTPFEGRVFDRFPAEWLEDIPGSILTSASVHVECSNSGLDDLAHHFEPESLASSEVLDNAALVASDFRIDSAGHVRFAVLSREGTGARRLGRIIQRLLEIETYKSMSMLTLPMARRVSGEIATIDTELISLVEDMAADSGQSDQTLTRLLRISSQLEQIASKNAFRFSAAQAYSAIVTQRTELLREVRFEGRQSLSEFMIRRFDPAMRTCASANARLKEISQRAERAATLHRTRLEEARSQQNAALLASMDKRAEQQLHLQKTVEGLSVVAIGYYAVNLAVYLLSPFAKLAGVDKTMLTALLVPFVLFLVWRIIKGIREKL